MTKLRKRVAIIGGGLSGIGACVCSKEAGLEPVCFEKTDKYGGTFCYREETIKGVGSVMPTTVLNHTKEMGSLSDFPPPKHFSTFLRHNEYYEYISLYYKHHNCEQYMNFNSEVINVKRNSDYEETGRFLVTIQNTITGEISADVFDAVTVATGHFNFPKFVKFPGQEKFRGTITHTHTLKDVAKFKDKKVLIIGSGCSALDAAVDISSVAKKVYISTRSGSYIMNRLGPFGYPFDYLLLRRFTVVFLRILPRNITSWFVERFFLDIKFHQSLYPVKPKYSLLSKDPVINDIISCKILSGFVTLKRNVKYFSESGVVFDGEETVTEIDDVIMATGYILDFSFLEKGLLQTCNDRIDLYKCVFPVHLRHATLAFIGFLNPFGPGVPVGELQNRWIAHVFSGKGKLPPPEKMMQESVKRYENNVRFYAPSDFNSLRVDFFQYAQDIASELGVKPNLFKYLFTDFPLFLKLAFGPLLPYQYRLEGPYKWDGARNAIMTSNERLYYPITRNTEVETTVLQHLYKLVKKWLLNCFSVIHYKIKTNVKS